MTKATTKEKRYFLKIALTAAEKKLVWKIFGPNRAVSSRIRELLLNPYARRNPDQWRELMESIARIERLFEALLRAQNPPNPSAMLDFLQACCAANQILKCLRKNAV